MKVLRVNAIDTYPIRQQMLRTDSPIERCKFTGDEEDQTFHLGAFMDSKLVSVASFYFEKHPELDEPFQFRLRGMATLPEYQGKGLSTELLNMAFPIIKQNFCHLVWCNARVSAVEFYQKVGFEKVGEEFDIPGIGPHLLMYKNIG
ncbi:MAG: GNAT family N-acetyltransferase [Bacteriovoracaceae bacterium]|nr:GNAT family N-acetyltransferase [Bacteriovoracaceae bacterium]